MTPVFSPRLAEASPGTALLMCINDSPEIPAGRRRFWRFGTKLWYYAIMLKKKHQTTLNAIFAKPVRSGIDWKNIEALLQALGALISEGSGSRVRIVLNERKAVFHRPHPHKETDKGAVGSMKRFLSEAGVKSC